MTQKTLYLALYKGNREGWGIASELNVWIILLSSTGDAERLKKVSAS